MVHFGIKRLHQVSDTTRRYHLYDETQRLKLVLEQGTPWLPAKGSSRARFALPNGEIVASFERPWRQRFRRAQIDYALIIDHAVYAIISQYPPTPTKQEAPAFIMKAGLTKWFALGNEEGEPFFTLYEGAPTNLALYTSPTAVALPEPIGHVNRATGRYHFIMSTPDELPDHASLLVLAFIFLIDRSEDDGC